MTEKGNICCERLDMSQVVLKVHLQALKQTNHHGKIIISNGEETEKKTWKSSEHVKLLAALVGFALGWCEPEVPQKTFLWQWVVTLLCCLDS